MKLLFDQNLSPRLVQRLADAFPGSSHVALLGLDSAGDRAVWDFARNQGFIIVSKDADFNDLTVFLGSPPQVIWLRLGNCTTAQVESCIRENVEMIEALAIQPSVGILELY